jgi:hypothetical protein
MPGVVSVAWLVVPGLSRSQAPEVPVWVAASASVVQGGLLLAVAVWAGSRLAPLVGFGAPAFAALAGSRPVSAGLRGRLLAGLLGGAAGALVLVAYALHAPEALHRLEETLSVPLAVRVLYGGITEELLMRWGLMTFLAWLLWRLAGRPNSGPGAGAIGTAVAVSAMVFGLGHLPAVVGSVGAVPLGVAAYVVAANAAFGVVAGVLFWRWGLESAMVAHVVAHLLAAGFSRCCIAQFELS